jgi:hypothetical protein
LNSLDIATADFALLALDFEPDQECDYTTRCEQVVQWRITCRLGGCWGLTCTDHMRACKRKQNFEDTRQGMRCPECKNVGRELMRFDPIISSSSETLW